MVLTPPWEQGCYRCLWPDDVEPERNCRTAGIVRPVVGVMGTLQALEAIKLLSGIETPSGELRLFDGKTSQWRSWRCVVPAAVRYAEGNMQIQFNDEPMQCAEGQTVSSLLATLNQLKPGAALALNQQILPREQWRQHIVQEGDQILLFQVIAGVEMLRIADKTFDSHLFTGTGKFASSQLMVKAIRLRQPVGDAGDEARGFTSAQRRYPGAAD